MDSSGVTFLLVGLPLLLLGAGVVAYATFDRVAGGRREEP